MHLITHLQNVGETYHVRLVCVNDISEYLEEYNRIYKTSLEYEVVYNIGYDEDQSLYTRLLADMKFKNFKCDSGKKSIGPLVPDDSGLYIIPNQTRIQCIKTWFKKVFVPYIHGKLRSYLDDDDECTPFLDLSKFLKGDKIWEEAQCCAQEFITYNSTERIFALENCHKDTYGNAILSPEHCFHLMVKYLAENRLKFKVEYKTWDTGIKVLAAYFGSGLPQCHVFKVQTLRGFSLSHTHLTTEDVEHVMSYILGESCVQDLGHIIHHFDQNEQLLIQAYDPYPYTWSDFDWDTDHINHPHDVIGKPSFNKANEHDTGEWWDKKDSTKKDRFTTMEAHFQAAKNDERFDEDHLCLHDRCSITATQDDSSQDDSMEESTKDTRKGMYTYKNKLTNELYVSEKLILYLSEFELLHDAPFTSDVSIMVMDKLSNKQMDHDMLDEVTRLCTLLSSFLFPDKNIHEKEKEDHRTEVADNTNVLNNFSLSNTQLQYMHTKEYVETNKDDELEIEASRVIENVYIYLRCKLPDKCINRNQIGEDLVNLGVKKIRKAKGYFYGIKNVSNLCNFIPFHQDLLESRSSQPPFLNSRISK